VSLLMGLFAVLFSSRPVVHLKVSMTFVPSALPIGFNGSVNVHLCFEITSATMAADSGNRQPSRPHMLCSFLSLQGGGVRGLLVWVLAPELLLLVLSSFVMRVYYICPAPRRVVSCHICPVGKGAWELLLGLQGEGSERRHRKAATVLTPPAILLMCVQSS
jgi:hypothetical protein